MLEQLEVLRKQSTTNLASLIGVVLTFLIEREVRLLDQARSDEGANVDRIGDEIDRRARNVERLRGFRANFEDLSVDL